MASRPSSADQEDIRKRVLELEILTRGTDTSAMLRKLQDLVPTFNPAEAHGLTPKARKHRICQIEAQLQRCVIGDHCRLGAHCFVGPGRTLGHRTALARFSQV